MDFKIGQEVYHSEGPGNYYHNARMTKILAIRGQKIVCEDGTQWAIRSRRSWGTSKSRWAYNSLNDLTPDMKARIEEDKRIYKASLEYMIMIDQLRLFRNRHLLPEVVEALRPIMERTVPELEL